MRSHDPSRIGATTQLLRKGKTMATIQTIVRNGKGTAGSSGAWRVTTDVHPFPGTFTLWHYATAMLQWRYVNDSAEILDYSTGNGSVSDQNGMNKTFRTLGVPYYYGRKGGAEIYETGAAQ